MVSLQDKPICTMDSNSISVGKNRLLVSKHQGKPGACKQSCYFLFQSARLRAAGFGKDFKENPNLRDNWTDAEGYYRKSLVDVQGQIE